MKILFVTIRSGIGGIETLIMRMISFLSAHTDINVSVLLITKGNNDEFINSVNSKCKIYFGKNIFKTYKEIREEKFDFIYSFGLFSLLFSLFLKKFFSKKSILSFGVYHPLEYCWNNGPNSYVRTLSYKIMRSFPLENIFFMNEGMKERHESLIGRNFLNSPIIPIPIDYNRMKNIKRNPNKKNIISIGRIVNFKTYIFHMIDVCCDINKNNSKEKVEFHIYGDGDLMKKLMIYVQKKNASEFVFVHGALPYSKMENILSDAFIFIGCGTALVEAAAAGVPSLISIESSQLPETYGFFYETNGYNLGEIDQTTKKFTIYEKVIDLQNKTEKEYSEIENLCQQKASLFSIDSVIYDFLEKIRNTKNFNLNLNIFNFFRIFLSFIFWKFVGKIGLKSAFSYRYKDEK